MAHKRRMMRLVLEKQVIVQGEAGCFQEHGSQPRFQIRQQDGSRDRASSYSGCDHCSAVTAVICGLTTCYHPNWTRVSTFSHNLQRDDTLERAIGVLQWPMILLNNRSRCLSNAFLKGQTNRFGADVFEEDIRLDG